MLSQVSLEKLAREEAEKANDAHAARVKAQKAELQLRDEKLQEVRPEGRDVECYARVTCGSVFSKSREGGSVFTRRKRP